MADNKAQCVFDNLGECTALTRKDCEDCKFYKSSEEYELNAMWYAVKKKRKRGGKQ